MWLKKIIPIALVVSGVLVFAATAPIPDWGRGTGTNANEVPIRYSWVEVMAVSNASKNYIAVAAVVPPYVVLDAVSSLGQMATENAQIRLSIDTMPGTYSQHLASNLISQPTNPLIPQIPSLLAMMPMEFQPYE